MTFVFITILSLIFIASGRLAFRSWFNHISIYVGSWYFIIFNYNLNYFRFYEIQSEAWFIIVATMTIFVLGALMGRFIYGDFSNEKLEINNAQAFTLNENKLKALKIILILSSLLGLIIAIYNWHVLIQKFGSIKEILLRGNKIYRMRVEGKLPEPIPYLHVISYTAVFLGAFYSAYINKISFWTIIAYAAVVIKEISAFGRAGILLATLIFFFSFFYSNKLFLGDKFFDIKKNYKVAIFFALIFIFAIIGAITVRGVRGTYENFKGASSDIRYSKNNLFLTPSLYFYFSSHIVVFSQYIKYSDEVPLKYGENTFMPIFNLLAKFDFVEKPNVYQKGYYTPYWSNTGTYLREIHEDFGAIGLFLIPFILGFSASYFMERFYATKSLFFLTLTVYFNSLVALSWLVMPSRTPQWFLSFILSLIITKLLFDKNFAKKKESK